MQVAKADKDLDGILWSQAAAQRWRQTYDTLTAQWRQEARGRLRRVWREREGLLP